MLTYKGRRLRNAMKVILNQISQVPDYVTEFAIMYYNDYDSLAEQSNDGN